MARQRTNKVYASDNELKKDLDNGKQKEDKKAQQIAKEKAKKLAGLFLRFYTIGSTCVFMAFLI